MNRLEPKEVKNPGTICDAPSHDHSRRRADSMVLGGFEQKATKGTKKRLGSSLPLFPSVRSPACSAAGTDFFS